MNLYEAIFVRKSVREYKMEEISPQLLDCIANFSNHLSMLQENQKVEYKILDCIKEYDRIKGLFFVKAPYYLVIGTEKGEGALFNVGYLMQQITLYLTTKGLGSCFLGIQKPPRQVTEVMKYEAVLMLAFGKAKDNIYREEEITTINRLESICVYKNEVGNDIKTLVKVAKLAPSSMNSQPWRLVAYENRIHVFNKKETILDHMLGSMKEINMGIMLANLLVAAEELWLETQIVKLDNIAEKSFKRNKYLFSLIIKQ